MLRLAASRGSELQRLGSLALGTGAQFAKRSAHTETNSVAELIKAVNSTPFSVSSLSSIKAATITPFYPPASASTGFSTQAKLLMLAVAGITLNNLDHQMRAHEWIVDMSLDVLQAAWWISFASFLPFRSIVLALRGMAPATATPISGLRTALVNLKAV